MENEWAQRARSFGQVAELYDRWRPGYPDALYADVLKLGPGGRVLEAGAGTGRATLALARRGAYRAQLRQQPQREDEVEPPVGFTPWSIRTYDWTAIYDTDSYSGLVQTHSDHLRLPAPQRERLVEAIRDAITRVGGGRLKYCYRAVLLHAQVL